MTYGMWKDGKDRIAIDVTTLIAGAILFVCPWLFAYAAEPAASWNAWVSGALVVALAAAAVYALAEWLVWANLVLGVWVLVSPWILGFSSHGTAMWTHVVLGLVVAALSAGEAWLFHRSPPRRMA